MVFRWNLGSDDAETEVDQSPDTDLTSRDAVEVGAGDESQRDVPLQDDQRSGAPAFQLDLLTQSSLGLPVVSAASAAGPELATSPASSKDASGSPSRRALRAIERSARSIGEISTVANTHEPNVVQDPDEPVGIQVRQHHPEPPHELAPQPAAASRHAAAGPRPNNPTTRRASKGVAPPVRQGDILSKLMTIGAMLGVTALMVSTSLPANAFYSAGFLDISDISAIEAGPPQSFAVKLGAGSPIPPRDGYTVASLAEQMRLKYGSRTYAYTNNPLGTIQWPFPVPVPIASGYGDRLVPNCGYCSTFHNGVDFTPGAGAPIQAIADGVVIGVNSISGGFGQHLVIEHTVNGQKVQSLYAHMLTGSIRVVQGQQIKVGDQVGQVGSTGASTGAHLHLETHIEGVPVDPFAWLKANAN